MDANKDPDASSTSIRLRLLKETAKVGRHKYTTRVYETGENIVPIDARYYLESLSR